MIQDIRNMMNSTPKNSNQSSSIENAGVITKLHSEIKLIQDLSLIRIQSSQNILLQGKPAQLLQATTNDQKALTLINTGQTIPLDSQQMAKLSRLTQGQANLTLANSQQTGPLVFNNLILASRILTLNVLSNSTPTSPNTYTTQVSDGHNSFQITGQTPLDKGANIRVLLDANNNLQVIPPKSATSVAPQIEAIKQSLPKQLTAPEMTQLIKQLQSLNTQSGDSLSPQTQRALNQLIQGLPSLETLTQSPEAMKLAIQTSGQFSESLLKNTSSNIPVDLKMNLTRLDNLAHSQEPERQAANFPTEQIANAIERITTNQLKHFSDLNQPNAQIFPLQMDLPIKENQTTNLVHLQINQDSSSGSASQSERRWLVKLNFDFPKTGRFEARLGIQSNKVGIVFAAENPETLAAIKQNMEELKRQLAAKDIEVQRLEAFQSKLNDTSKSVPVQTSLIDVRT